jgi:putative transposase
VGLPASVDRVLAAHDLVLPKAAHPGAGPAHALAGLVGVSPQPGVGLGRDPLRALPGRPNAFAIIDLVSRKWLATLLSAEETSTQVEVVFGDALGAEGLMELVAARQDGRVDLAQDDPGRPLLLAVSDNGPQMTSGSTREFLALCSIVQHFGRPHTPTDQAPIESFFGHLKGEWPHLERLRDPDELRAELEVVPTHYNTVRLHAGIGYVTPDDEHSGRGAQIRTARRQGLEWARRRRIAYHRKHGKETRP